MRAVSSEVFHLWAHQAQPEANTGRNGNVSFRGTTLYSYSTPIANIVKDKLSRSVALLSSSRYSPTTGKHINAAMSALRGSDRIGPNGGWEAGNEVMSAYTVPFLGVTGGRAFHHADAENMVGVHKANVQSMLVEYAKELAKAARMLDDSGWFKDHLAGMVATAREYAERFGVDRRKVKFPDVEKDWLPIAERFARLKTPEAAAKRKKAADRRDAKARDDYRNVRGKYGVDWRGYWWRPDASPDDISEEDKVERARNLGTYWDRYITESVTSFVTDPAFRPECSHDLFPQSARDQRAAMLQRHYMEAIERWRNGAPHISRWFPRTSTALLRIRGE